MAWTLLFMWLLNGTKYLVKSTEYLLKGFISW